MARADRLFRLLDALRRLPPPATAAQLARATEVSERTIYRDIEALRVSGARIDGAAGYGFVLEEDPALPPQSLSRLELEALTLGIASLRHLADPDLAIAGERALAKITATLPECQSAQAAHAVLSAYRFAPRPRCPLDLTMIRAACWDENALDITYEDAGGEPSERRIWPLAIIYLEREQTLLAWCTLRQAHRQFILSRITAITATRENFRPRRVPLLREMIGELRRI